MKYLLPIPSADHIPPYANAKPFTDMLDKQFTQWFKETIAIDDIKVLAKTPPQFLDKMGEMFAADILPTDTIRTKRVKVLLSQDVNKRRGMWITIKDILDSASGGNAKIVNSSVIDSSDTDLMSVEGEDLDYGDPYYHILNSIQADYTADYGMRMSGENVIISGGNTVVFNDKGMLNVDLGVSNPPLDADIVEQIRKSIEMQVAAYFRMRLGYVENSKFIYYSNGTVN